MNPPCIGTLQKTHAKSKFKKFHATSQRAEWVFSSNPRLLDKGSEIVVLQIMCFGNNELLMEYVDKKDWEE
jgi:hypothetical protein